MKIFSFILFIAIFTSIQGYGLLTNEGDPLELLELKTKVFIKGPYAEIQYLCTYKNTFDKAVKTQFLFPKPAKSILSKYEIQIQNQIISTKIVEKQLAKENYLSNAGGSTIANDYQLNADDKDTLDIKIGEIPSKEIVQIIFTLLQPLDIIINKFFGLTLPAVLKHKEWTIEVELESNSPLSFESNPSHQFKPEFSFYMSGNNVRTDKIIWQGKTDTSKDFVLYFRSKKMQDPRVLLAAHPEFPEDYVLLLNFVPNLNNVDLKTAQNMLATDSDGLSKAKALAFQDDIKFSKGEFLFVIDRSNSMRGALIENLKKALVKFLLALPKNAFFNIISFGSTYSLYKPQSVQNGPEVLEEALTWVYKIDANMGGTEILGAFQHLTSHHYKQNDDYQTVFVFTDGSVFNSDDIIYHVKRFSPHRMRFCSVGIGSEASRYLVNGIGGAGNCESVFVLDNEDIGDKTIHLVKSTISQYISDIQFRIMCFDDKNRVLYSDSKTYKRLLKDQAFTEWVYLTHNTVNLTNCHATLTYFNSLKGRQLVEEFDISSFKRAEKTERLHKLAYHSKIEADKDRHGLHWIQQDLVKYQVLSKHTALLANTKENNFDNAETSKKRIYLTDLSSADYQKDELNRGKFDWIFENIWEATVNLYHWDRSGLIVLSLLGLVAFFLVKCCLGKKSQSDESEEIAAEKSSENKDENSTEDGKYRALLDSCETK